MKFLLDENLSPLHARTLRALGHDAVSVVELGLSGADDPVVRDVAIRQERILVTLDADFANVLMFPPSETPGVVRNPTGDNFAGVTRPLPRRSSSH